MLNNSYLSDVTFKLKDGQEMVAHSFILSLRSEVLAQVHVETLPFFNYLSMFCFTICDEVINIIDGWVYSYISL